MFNCVVYKNVSYKLFKNINSVIINFVTVPQVTILQGKTKMLKKFKI
jgi:hypothetical protein